MMREFRELGEVWITGRERGTIEVVMEIPGTLRCSETTTAYRSGA